MLQSARELYGYNIRARDGEFGKVHDVYFDDQAWIVRYVVAETGDWLLGQKVLLTSDLIGNPAEHVLPVKLNRREIEQSPSAYSDKPVSLQRRREPHEYYLWTPYWDMAGAGAGALSISPLLIEVEERKRAAEERKYDPHLRSSREVIGYHIQTAEGAIGHVEDFVLDVATWAIPNIVIDTRNWLPGKKVLIAPRRIAKISWAKRKVHIALPREVIKNRAGFDLRAYTTARR